MNLTPEQDRWVDKYAEWETRYDAFHLAHPKLTTVDLRIQAMLLRDESTFLRWEAERLGLIEREKTLLEICYETFRKEQQARMEQLFSQLQSILSVELPEPVPYRISEDGNKG